MTDDVVTLDVHGKIFHGKWYLVVVCQSSTCKIVKVIKLFKEMFQGILGDFSMIIITSFYNYFYCYYFHVPLQTAPEASEGGEEGVKKPLGV